MAALALVLAVVLLAGWKGVLLELGGILLLAAVAAGAALSLMPAGRRGRTFVDECRWLAAVLARPAGSAVRGLGRAERVLGPTIAVAAALAVVVVGFVEGAPVAGGSDSYGYVSQAHLWATGKLRVEPPLLHELTPVAPARALVPLGYILASDHETIVPTYSPGLPMVMAVFERLFGSDAVYWVVPLLGGLAVGSAYLLGRRVAGPLGGAGAAVLVASSPVLLFQLTAAPMSDLPATAWWTLALALVFVDARWAAFAGGFAGALAILTRPNLAPLAIVPGAFLLWRAWAEWRSFTSSERAPASPWDARATDSAARLLSLPAARRLLLFTIGVVPGCLGVAAVYTHLYGSPLRSGYDVRGLYGLENLWPNVVRYPQVLTVLETPLIWLAVVAPFLCRRQRARHEEERSGARTGTDSGVRDAMAAATVSLCFVLATFACYLFYPGFDAHRTLRFLLPAMPALLVLLSASIVALASRLPPVAGAAVGITAVALVALHGADYARDHAAFDTSGERKYAVIGEYVARRLPDNAVLLAMQHSGSVRHYSGRPTVRYDQIPKRRLDRVIGTLERLGYRPYLLLEHWEEDLFRERFRHRSRLALLDWPPLVELPVGNVRIYDPADREAVAAGEERSTEILPWPFPR